MNRCITSEETPCNFEKQFLVTVLLDSYHTIYVACNSQLTRQITNKATLLHFTAVFLRRGRVRGRRRRRLELDSWGISSAAQRVFKMRRGIGLKSRGRVHQVFFLDLLKVSGIGSGAGRGAFSVIHA